MRSRWYAAFKGNAVQVHTGQVTTAATGGLSCQYHLRNYCPLHRTVILPAIMTIKGGACCKHHFDALCEAMPQLLCHLPAACLQGWLSMNTDAILSGRQLGMSKPRAHLSRQKAILYVSLISTADTLKHQLFHGEHMYLSTCHSPQCRSRLTTQQTW